MPSGRLSAGAGRGAWTKQLHFGVNLRSLRLLRSTRKSPAHLSSASIRRSREILREAFKRAQVDFAREHPTPTELRERLSKVATAARRYAKSGDLKWADMLLGYLDDDRDAAQKIRQKIEISGLEWIGFKKELRDVYARHASSDKSIGVARQIAAIEIGALVPQSGPWPDPALFALVLILAPVWTEITGRTAAPVSADATGDKKVFPFARWLEGMLGLLDLPLPPDGRVLDIVRFQKGKNPAPVTARKD